MSPPSKLLGYLFAATGAAFFSTKAIFIKLAYQEHVGAALMLAYRMIFSVPFFVGIGLWALSKRRENGEAAPGAGSIARAGIGLYAWGETRRL